MTEERPKWPSSLPPLVELTEGPSRVDLTLADLSTSEDVSGLVSDLYWHSDDQYYLFFKHENGIGAELAKELESQGLALRKTEFYFYRHPYPVSERDFIRVLPGELEFDWQRQAAAGEMFGRITVTLEPWRRKQLDGTTTASATQRTLEDRHFRSASGERELEQKFRILYSAAQEQRDFDRWTAETIEHPGYAIGVIFLDVDDFKHLNSVFTETVVDKAILSVLQRLVRSFFLHRGAVYRHGGEELVAILPNHSLDETIGLAEKVRDLIETHRFKVQEEVARLTVSLGVASWPLHGADFESVLAAANRAEHTAKDQGKNRVCVATAQQQ
jgi:diguanylate cyclase (GGDEF)-like protein